MSLLKKLGKGLKSIIKKAAPLAAIALPMIPGIGGVAGKVLGGLAGIAGGGVPSGTLSTVGGISAAPVSLPPIQPSAQVTNMSMMSGLGALTRVIPGLGGVAAGAAGVAVAGARTAASAARAAATWCRKNPAWCAQVGGVAAIAGMVQQGQLPMPARRRRRGITPKDLQSFRRVANLIHGYCPTVRRIPRRARR